MRAAAGALAALAGAAALACRSPEPDWERGFESAFAVRAAPGLEDHVGEFALLVRAWSPQVAARLGVERRAPLTVWLQDELVYGAHGWTTDRSIAVVPHTARHFTLVHELAHWHMRGTAWERLPQAVEEGLCDAVAAEGLGIEPGIATALVPLLAEAFERSPELLAITNTGYLSLPREQQHLVRALGWYLARHHGVDGLRALVERASSEDEVRSALAGTPLDVATVAHLVDQPNGDVVFGWPDGVAPRVPARSLVLGWRSATGELLSLTTLHETDDAEFDVPAGATAFSLQVLPGGE